MNPNSQTHFVYPNAPHTHTIIILHGRDSTASEFASEFFESQASDERTLPEIFPFVKWVFPNSGVRTSARFKIKMSQWFDMWSVENPTEQDELQIVGLKQSIEQIRLVVEEEAAIIGYKNLFLGGISQGGATAIMALLVMGVEVGGFLGLCSWLPFQNVAEITEDGTNNEVFTKKFKEFLCNGQWDLVENESESARTPVFLGHSTDDEGVPIENGLALCCGLRKLGFVCEWKQYEDAGHWVDEPVGVDDISEFLKKHGVND